MAYPKQSENPESLDLLEDLLRRRDVAAAAGGQELPELHALTPQELQRKVMEENIERMEARRAAEGGAGGLLGQMGLKGSRFLKDMGLMNR